MRLGMSEGAILVSGGRQLQAAETPSANATGQECSWLGQGAAGRPVWLQGAKRGRSSCGE